MTIKHKTTYICECCDQSWSKRFNYDRHMTSVKHKKNNNKKIQLYPNNVGFHEQSKVVLENIPTPITIHKNNCEKTMETIYICNCCNYSSKNKKDTKKHLKTIQHVEKGNDEIVEQYVCTTCEKTHTNYKTCWGHSKRCKSNKLNKSNELEKSCITQHKYYCKACCYFTNVKLNLKIHCFTDKHVRNCEGKNENIVIENTELPINEKLHRPKRKTIPLALRRNVWNKYIGEEIGKTLCLCCKLTDISQMTFSCGHIVSVYNGGDINLENLKPICVSCNSSMGTQNMDEFIQNYRL